MLKARTSPLETIPSGNRIAQIKRVQQQVPAEKVCSQYKEVKAEVRRLVYICFVFLFSVYLLIHIMSSY